MMDFINDKAVYAAVKWAVKLMAENHFFNKSCQIAAKHYGVSESLVRKYAKQRLHDTNSKEAKDD